ncbi:MAG: hypothetical protein U0Q55_16740 [Vicinamibacterales bacterium]
MNGTRMPRHRRFDSQILGWVIFGVVTLLSSSAFAQARLRVLDDETPVWRPGFFSAAAIVDAGTELELVGRQGDWYEVRLPPKGGAPADGGFVAVSRVEVIGSAQSILTSRARMRRIAGGRARNPQMSGVSGSGEIGVERFSAAKAFRAVTGDARGIWVGVGANYRTSSGLFGGVSVLRASKSGERIVPFETSTYRVGISNRITLTAFEAVVGLRRPLGQLFWHTAVGAGVYRAVEGPEGAGTVPEDRMVSRHIGYKVIGGLEKRLARRLATVAECAWSLVPVGGTSGAMAATEESGLGGVRGSLKLVIGK